MKTVKLKEICELIRGSGLSKNELTNIGVGAVHYGEIYTKYNTISTDKTFSFVTPEKAKGLKTVNKGDIILTVTSENMDDVLTPLVWLGEEDIVVGGHTVILKHKQNPKYLAHYFQSDLIDKAKRKIARGVKVIEVSLKDLANIEILLPSLEEQEKIVSILDKIENLISLLEKELDLRKKQFEWYLKTLISNQNFTKRKIKDIAEFRRGSFPQPYGNQEWYGGDESMPFIQVYDIQDTFSVSSKTKKQISKLAQPKSVYVPPGKVIVSLQGSIGRVAKTERASFIDRTIAVFTSIDESINIDYFIYALKYIFDIKKQSARGTTIKTITKNEFSSFLIPIPSINQQKEIVQTLNSILELRKLLEQEIKLRQKQLQYYRNKLLTDRGRIF